MCRIKGRASSKLFEEFPNLKKRYWGRHSWGRGYFCATVAQINRGDDQGVIWSITLSQDQMMISEWNQSSQGHVVQATRIRTFRP